MQANRYLRQAASLALLALPTAGLLQNLEAQRGRGGLPGWINEDIDRGLAQARTSGKPLLVVFRCPP